MRNHDIAQKIRDIREKISELREEDEILSVKIKNKMAEVDSLKEKRDELNNQVKELSSKPKEIMTQRKEVWGNIEDMNEEKKSLYKKMQPYLQRIGELRKVRDELNHASRGRLDRLVKNMEQTSNSLLTDDLSLKNELYQYDFLFEIRDRILIKARADAIHQEIVRIKEVDLKEYNQVIDKMENRIGGLKSQSHEGLMTAKEIWTKRDEIRDEAQKYHKEFIQALNSAKEIKKQGWKLKKEINSLYREIDNWKKEFDKSPAERKKADNSRRLEEVLAKYKKGESLSLEELSLLVESGKMKD